ncbi:MAG TPA: hypothetical protein VK009_16745 [Chloroflexota bacterium]|nr:hypothetical protein [Chloroflexota bacterium]
MEMTIPPTDAQRLYKQWQDGKLLDVEERRALRLEPEPNSTNGMSFAELLKSSAEMDS